MKSCKKMNTYIMTAFAIGIVSGYLIHWNLDSKVDPFAGIGLVSRTSPLRRMRLPHLSWIPWNRYSLSGYHNVQPWPTGMRSSF